VVPVASSWCELASAFELVSVTCASRSFLLEDLGVDFLEVLEVVALVMLNYLMVLAD